MTDCIDVSVVVPSYNSARFIDRCVQSALRQKGVSVEVIVIDDEGTDATREIIRDVRKSDPRLHLIERAKGLGQSTARNVGIDGAKGRYVALLDSDDAFTDDGVLQEWVEAADRDELDLTIAQHYSLSESGRERRPARLVPVAEGTVNTLVSEPKLVNVTSCWQILYRREFLDENGLRFSKKLRQREDRLFVIQTMLKAARIGCIDMFAVDHYRISGSSYSKVDLDQVRQFTTHLAELNDAREEAISAGSDLTAFDRANAASYLLQLSGYWSRTILETIGDESGESVIGQLLEEYRRLVAGASDLYLDQAFDSRNKEDDLREGKCDALRLALLARDDELLVRFLRGEPLSLRDAQLLKALFPDQEFAIANILSFSRKRLAQHEVAAPARRLTDRVKRIVLHCGYTKTGSSTLQNLLEKNRFRLWEAGIHYPLIGSFRERGIRRHRVSGQANLFQSVIDGEGGVEDALCDEIDGLQADIHTLVLSAENICSPRFWSNGDGYRKIVDAVGDAPIEIGVVFRRQDEWAKSAYKEMLSNPWNRYDYSFVEFAKIAGHQGLLNYQEVSRILNEPAAVTAVHAASFEAVVEKGGTEAWFCDILGVPLAELEPVDQALTNESVPDSLTSLTSILKSNRFQKRTQLTRGYLRLREGAQHAGAPYHVVSYQEANAFRKRYAEEIEAYDEFAGREESSERMGDLRRPLPADDTAIELSLSALSALRRSVAAATAPKSDDLALLHSAANEGKGMHVRLLDNGVLLDFQVTAGERISSVRIQNAGPNGFEVATMKRSMFQRSECFRISREMIDQWLDRGVRDIVVKASSNRRSYKRFFRLFRSIETPSTLLPPAV